MIRIFVSASGTDGQTLVSESYEFMAVPRVGERVILDNRGGLDDTSALPPLVVTDVINHAEPKGDVASPLQYVELICKAIG